MSRRQKRLQRQAFVNIALAAAIIGVIGYVIYAMQPAPYDPRTLCPYTEAGDIAPPHTVVVLDKTDAYSANEAELIANTIQRTKDRLAVGERITIAALDERGRTRPELSLCNPGRGDQVNPLFSNPVQIQTRYEELFRAPLDAALSDLITPKQAPASPIAEAIVRQAQLDTFGPTTPRRRMVLISDMLQNSDVFTVYGGERSGVLPDDLPSADIAAQLLMERFGDNLAGVQIEVRLIPRTRWEDAQRGVLRRYWENLASELGARLVWRDL